MWCLIVSIPDLCPLSYFNGIIQTILVAFSMKTSRACTGILSSENDDFQFLKTAKNLKSIFTIVPGLIISPNQFIVDQKHERKSSHRIVLHVFQNIEFLILVTFHWSTLSKLKNLFLHYFVSILVLQPS